MVQFVMRPEMTRRPRNIAVPPTPSNEENHIYHTTEQPLRVEPITKQIKQEFCTPGLPLTDWKKFIEDAIESQTTRLIEFLEEFSAASKTPIQKSAGKESWDGYATTAPVATVVSSFLSSRHAKSVSLGSPTFPSVVSVFDEGEGPCLVLNGLLTPGISSPSHPYSFNKSTGPLPHLTQMPANAAGTAAIVAAYAYLHSIRHHLIGTVVLSAISDTEEGHLGTCRHLLHTDERKTLWRGYCMITAASTPTASASPLFSPDMSSSRPATFDAKFSSWQRNSSIQDFTPSRLSTTCAIHPVATSLSNNGKRVLGRRPSIPDFQTGRKYGSHARFWAEVGVPSFCIGVGGVESSATSSPQPQLPDDARDQDAECDGMVDSGIQDVMIGEQSVEEIDNGGEGMEEMDRKQWIQLVKVLVLTAWDQVGLEE